MRNDQEPQDGERGVPQIHSRPTSDLFAPSLQSHQAPATGEKPWRISSQLLVAFFGGVVAYSTIAYLNSRRLGIAPNRQRIFILIGIIGFLCTILADYLIVTTGFLDGARDSTIVRLSSRLVAVLTYVVVSRMQKSADRIYQFSGGDEYASLWQAGLAATVGLGLLQNIVVSAIVSALVSNILTERL